jgi:hypothetical protein
MIARENAFSFIDAGRTFTCQIGPLRASAADAWWWFDVSSEAHQRHAPFRATADDTTADVQARIVAYYDDLLARRAAPAPTRWNSRNRARTTESATPAVAVAATPTAADPAAH